MTPEQLGEVKTIERCNICGLLHPAENTVCKEHQWPTWWLRLSLDNRHRYYEYTSNTKSANEFVDRLVKWREYLVKRGDEKELE